MNYCKIKKVDIANGVGVRVSLFVSGCRNHCKGCFQPETWNFSYGEHYDRDKTTSLILDYLKPNYITGLTILGGDPMEKENQEEVLWLCAWVKRLYPNKTIWLYTGYRYEDFKDYTIMKYIDVLVDGKYIEEQRDISLAFKGSRNQRIIDMVKTRKYNKVVEVKI